MLFSLVFLAALVAIFLLRRKLTYWQSRGIPGPTPLPIVGNYGANIIGKKNSYEISADIYKKYADYPFVGIYRMGDPGILLRDPEIIKNVLVKDFNHFVNNEIFVDKKLDPMLGLNPFMLKDEEWKTIRQHLTPGFAPAKIKTFFPLVEKVAKNFATYLARHEGTALDVKEICGRYTCDTVALCAFGLEGNSFEDSNADFLQIFREFATPDTLQSIKLAISLFLPHFKIKVLPKCFDDAVIGLTEETLKYRQQNNIIRNDYFEAMCEIGKGSLVETAAHLSAFMLDGYETSSTGMTFVIYELAKNPKCQQKLREEINTTLKNNDGELSYDALKDLTYLEACINESLRIHPPLGQLAKTCTKSYNITSTKPEFKNLSATIEPDTPVIIPLLGLHMDPKYFSSPEKFIPERFLDKSETQKYVYMPFGTGQRSCLGSRMALLQAKVGLASIIKNFEIKLDEKSQGPLKYDPMYFLLNPKGGAWISCRKISE